MPASILHTDALLARVQMCFARFSTSGLMNERQFTELCVEMAMINRELICRLFHAFDNDNTGALELPEFAEGLRRMCEFRRDRDSKAEAKRTAFAFRLLDEDGGGLVEMSEVQQFLECFLESAKQDALGWIDHFETIFGAPAAGHLAAGAGGGVAHPRTALEAHGELGPKLRSSLASAEAHSEDFVRITSFAEIPTKKDVERLFGEVPELSDFKPAKLFVVPGGEAFVSFMDTLTDGEANAELRKLHQKKVSEATKALDGLEFEGAKLGAAACSGIDAVQFAEWCSSSGHGRMNLVAWLRIIGCVLEPGGYIASVAIVVATC